MKIIFDLDDTLVNFAGAICLFHNERYGTKLKFEDFFSYDFTKVWGGTREQETTKVREFFESDGFLDMDVLEGAKEFVSTLQGDELFIVTSRPLYSQDVTKKQISMHFENQFNKIFHSTHIFGSNGNKKTKKEICDEIGADVVIEDSADNANSLASDGVKIFLFNKPWNINQKTDARIIRVDHWSDIKSQLNLPLEYVQE
jgi:uncharacterized protein